VRLVCLSVIYIGVKLGLFCAAKNTDWGISRLGYSGLRESERERERGGGVREG